MRRYLVGPLALALVAAFPAAASAQVAGEASIVRVSPTSYRLDVKNTGSDTITSVQFVKALRAATITAVRPAPCEIVSGGNGFRCRPVALAPGASASYEFDTAGDYPDGANATVLLRGGTDNQGSATLLATGPGTGGSSGGGELDITGVSARRAGVRITVSVPGPGRLLAIARARAGRRRVTLVSRAASASEAGTVAMLLRPTSAARRLLGRRRSVRATVKVSFTPEEGAASSVSRSVTFRLR